MKKEKETYGLILCSTNNHTCTLLEKTIIYLLLELILWKRIFFYNCVLIWPFLRFILYQSKQQFEA